MSPSADVRGDFPAFALGAVGALVLGLLRWLVLASLLRGTEPAPAH